MPLAYTCERSVLLPFALRIRNTIAVLLCVIAVAVSIGRASATEPRIAEIPLLRMKTLGGPIVWTDYVLHSGWRIQRHAIDGDYRLLDDRDRRVASGCMDHCFRELRRRCRNGELKPMGRHVVIVMHGLAGSRRLMAPLANHLRKEGGYCVLNYGYASTKGTIQELTLGLESTLRNLCGVQEVSFVCHSMSNIMVRHMLYRIQLQEYPPQVHFRRMVMISPPNHGAKIADSLGQRCIFQCALGDAVDQFALTKGWPCMEQQLAIPDFEFGIIAGGRCNDKGYIRAIPGDDDSVVGIQSHFLTGASDFTQVGGAHQIMPLFRDTQDATLRFLKCGHF